MKTIYFLTMMQLKDKLDLSGKSKKDFLFMIVFGILKFVLITAVIYLAFYVLNFFKWVSLKNEIPVEVMVVILSLALLLSLITCTIKITNSLYFSKDNQFLLTMPTSKTQLFISKLLLVTVYELIKNINYLLPLFIAYGMINAYPISFYFWILFCFVIITFLVVSISGLLSIPTMQLSILLKRYFWLKTVFITLLTAGAIFIVAKLISILPTNFNIVETWSSTYWQIQDFLKTYSEKLSLLTELSKFVVGEKIGKEIVIFSEDTFIALLKVLGAFALIMTTTILLIRPLFFKMASVPFEHKKIENIKKQENVKLSPFMSFLKKEVLLIVRTPSKLNALILISIITPLAIFLMNKIYMAMDVRPLGNYMIIAFNVLMITLMVTSSNTNLSTSLSEEGQSFYLTKINPNKYETGLITKLIFNVAIISISLLFSVGIFVKLRGLDFGQGVLIYLIIECIYISHALWSAELDVMNPQYSQYALVGSMINNTNEVKSGLLSFALSCILALFTFVNFTENTLNYYNAWIKILLFCICFLAYRIYMYINQIRLYYKEK